MFLLLYNKIYVAFLIRFAIRIYIVFVRKVKRFSKKHNYYIIIFHCSWKDIPPHKYALTVETTLPRRRRLMSRVIGRETKRKGPRSPPTEPLTHREAKASCTPLRGRAGSLVWVCKNVNLGEESTIHVTWSSQLTSLLNNKKC